MPAVIGKRKREAAAAASAVPSAKKLAAINGKHSSKPTKTASAPATVDDNASNSRSRGPKPSSTTAAQDPFQIQIVTGSYERVLHGMSVAIPQSALLSTSAPTPDDDVKSASKANGITFSHSFLFTAHASAIRCLAISPALAEADKRILATGSSDERINIYSLSTSPPAISSSMPNTTTLLPSLSENPRNKSQGSLVHHDRAITCLAFPTKTKLFSGAEDATIAIARTRDWTVLSSIKAPIPKPQGRPSGDTAAPGQIPAGINAFAIHPSQKLMLSVGRGERCMRLWNLMTGKKAGVLNFSRELLTSIGESGSTATRHNSASGEARAVLWDAAGESFVVGFERGAIVFGIDSQPRGIIVPAPATKLHHFEFVQDDILAISTENGRVLFYNIASLSNAQEDGDDAAAAAEPPKIKCVAQLGGPAAGLGTRIKAFSVLPVPSSSSPSEAGDAKTLLVITASSDGAIRLWTLNSVDLTSHGEKKDEATRQVGTLLATQETGERITCLGAFPLDGAPEDEHVRERKGEAEEEFEGFDDEDEAESAEDDNDRE